MAFRYGYFDSDIIGIDDEGMPIFDRAETSDLFALLFASLEIGRASCRERELSHV